MSGKACVTAVAALLLCAPAGGQTTASAPAEARDGPVRVDIRLDPRGRAVCAVGDRTFADPAELFKWLKAASGVARGVLIAPAGDVPWKDVVATFAEAQRAGFARVRLAVGEAAYQPASAPAQRQVVKVSTAQELIEAVGSDRVIQLSPGEYDLEKVAQRDLKCVRWEKVMDAWEIHVEGASNLRIEGLGDKPVRVTVSNPYAFVLTLRKCDGLELVNLELGHAPKQGFCRGGVIEAAGGCRNLTVRKCVLFGSGTEGLSLADVEGLLFEDSVIRDCTYGILTARNCRNMVFRNSRFTNNRQYSGFVMDRCGKVAMTACHVEGNFVRGSVNEPAPLFQVASGTELTLTGCKVINNRYAVLADPASGLKTEDTEIKGNTPPPLGEDPTPNQ